MWMRYGRKGLGRSAKKCGKRRYDYDGGVTTVFFAPICVYCSDEVTMSMLQGSCVCVMVGGDQGGRRRLSERRKKLAALGRSWIGSGRGKLGGKLLGGEKDLWCVLFAACFVTTNNEREGENVCVCATKCG